MLSTVKAATASETGTIGTVAGAVGASLDVPVGVVDGVASAGAVGVVLVSDVVVWVDVVSDVDVDEDVVVVVVSSANAGDITPIKTKLTVAVVAKATAATFVKRFTFFNFLLGTGNAGFIQLYCCVSQIVNCIANRGFLML